MRCQRFQGFDRFDIVALGRRLKNRSVLDCKYGPKNGFELGYSDPIVKNGRWRLGYAPLREYDSIFDPPVTNSQVTSRVGYDTAKHPDQTTGDCYKGMKMDEWRYKVLYRENPTIKHIYDNWDISPEHPGMAFRPSFHHNHTTLKHHGWVSNVGKLWLYKALPGGAYYDDPEGEQCFRKTFACIKTAFIGTIPFFCYDLAFGSQRMGFKNQAKLFARMAYMPVIAAACFGAIACLACSTRKRDDLINYSWGSAAADGVAPGIKVGVLINTATWLWRIFRDYQLGLYGHEFRYHTTIGPQPDSHKYTHFPGVLDYNPKMNY
uniref:Uncharacterized protein n=1 Tax=Romanomermis culicivorax TaxID=13658 RepID=A0A915JBN7_ROMCU